MLTSEVQNKNRDAEPNSQVIVTAGWWSRTECPLPGTPSWRRVPEINYSVCSSFVWSVLRTIKPSLLSQQRKTHRIHNKRHTFPSNCTSAGLPLHNIQLEFHSILQQNKTNTSTPLRGLHSPLDRTEVGTSPKNDLSWRM